MISSEILFSTGVSSIPILVGTPDAFFVSVEVSISICFPFGEGPALISSEVLFSTRLSSIPILVETTDSFFASVEDPVSTTISEASVKSITSGLAIVEIEATFLLSSMFNSL